MSYEWDPFLFIQKLKIDKSYNIIFESLQKLTKVYKSKKSFLHFMYFYLLVKDFYFKILERKYMFQFYNNLYILYMCLIYLKYSQRNRFYFIYIVNESFYDFGVFFFNNEFNYYK